MRTVLASSLLAFFVSSAKAADQTGWGQCGGKGWSGPTTCVNGWKCTYSNDWYSQCLPSTSTTVNPTGNDVVSTTSRTTSSRSTTTAIITDWVTTTPRSTSTRSNTPIIVTTTRTTTTRAATTAAGSLPTLSAGNLWIRAVSAPNFHYYIQGNSETAVLGPNTSAGQYRITSGQLTQVNADGSLLYANVEYRSDSTDMLLGVKFLSTPNDHGVFSWGGDALTWITGDITRPNTAAWYVCGSDRQLFINLGQYLYGTPQGCTDHTIHFYNGATPDF